MFIGRWCYVYWWICPEFILSPFKGRVRVGVIKLNPLGFYSPLLAAIEKYCDEISDFG